MSTKKMKMMDAELPVKIDSLSKWVPLICAAAAAGVSIIALKEIKNVRNELVVIKKEQSVPINDELNKRMKMMEEQLRTITHFLKNKDKVTCSQNVKESEPLIKNIIKETDNINIINNDEYEEIEVTDDETDEI